MRLNQAERRALTSTATEQRWFGDVYHIIGADHATIAKLRRRGLVTLGATHLEAHEMYPRRTMRRQTYVLTKRGRHVARQLIKFGATGAREEAP